MSVCHSRSCALWPDDLSSSRSSYRTSATWTAWLRSRSTRNRKASAASNWAVRNNTWKYRKGCWLARKWDSPVRRQTGRTFSIPKHFREFCQPWSCGQVPHGSRDCSQVVLPASVNYHPSVTSVRNMKDLFGAWGEKNTNGCNNSIKWLLSYS